MLRFKEKNNSWPGFVDLFSNLVIILIFLLIVFVFLWTTTNVFHSKASNEKVIELTQITNEQANTLQELTADNDALTADNTDARLQLLTIKDELRYAENKKNELLSEIDTLDQQLLQRNVTIEQLTVSYEDKLRKLNDSSQVMAETINSLSQQLDAVKAEKASATAKLAEMSAKGADVSVYESKLSILQEQLNYLNSALTAAEQKSRAQQVEYAALSTRLNRALADKAAELAAKQQNADNYQSEFYKEIKTALANRTTVDTSSDRFVVPSDILFPSGAYALSNEGKNQLRLIANVIKDMERVIPTNVNWIIRVDGHTDKKPVVAGTRGYKNNTELSLLRATAVVHELEKNGVSKRRLAPAGFGELYPVTLGTDAASLQQNRRIELRLTNP